MARAYTNVSMQTLGNWVNGDGVDNEIKLQAIKVLLDRGWGRPVSKTEVTGADGSNAIEVTVRTIIEGKK